MNVKVGINGMGRIGRDFLRLSLELDDVEVVAVNDVYELELLADLLRYDSSFGPLGYEVEVEANTLLVDGRKILATRNSDPLQLDWAEADVDLVLESTGRLRTREAAAQHLLRGAPRVVLSAPGKDVDATIVMGVNDDTFSSDRHYVISNGSCTTNCAAPMVKVLHDAFGVQQGFLTTVHAYTNDQNLLDGPHQDARRARAAAVNIIPTSTGAARAVATVIPELDGRLDGVALRVPVVDGSLVDLGVLLDREVSVADVNRTFREASAAGRLHGLLRFTDQPLVSSDIIGDDASCVFDSRLTQVQGRFVKVFGWYDNEWGYTNRLADLARLIAD